MAERILYVDLAPRAAGSLTSLEYLLRHLDRRYQPAVIMARGQRRYGHFVDLKVNVVSVLSPQGQAVRYGGGIDRIRGGNIGAWIRRRPVVKEMWHGFGFLGRIARRFYPQAKELASIMARVQPDLVHVNDRLTVSRGAVWAANMNRLPVVSHVRGWDQWTLFDRWLDRGVRRYICISQAIADQMAALGVSRERLSVVYNGLDVADFPTVANPALRQQWQTPTQAPLVGIVGRVVPWKGHRVFLQAVERVAQDYPDLVAWIIGEPEVGQQGYLEELEQLARALGIASRVRFLGHQENVPALLPSLDVLVHASVEPEPFGRVIIEGMAAERAVVATAAGAVPEIVLDKETGLLVPPGDAPALARAICRLLDLPAWRIALGKAGREHVRCHFSAAQMVSGVEAVYAAVLEHK